MIFAAITYVVGAILFAAWMVFLLVFANPSQTVTRSELLIASLYIVAWPITLIVHFCIIAYAYLDLLYSD